MSDETLAAYSLFLALGPTWNTEKEGNTAGARPNPNTPKRHGVSLSGPDYQRDRTEEVTENGMEAGAFNERHTVGLVDADVVVTVTWAQPNRVGRAQILDGRPTE